MPTPRHELAHLVRLAWPIAATHVGNMAMGVVDTLFLGHVGVEALAAAAIGNAFLYGTLLAGQGIVLGIDPLVTQAHGAGDGRALGLALQRGLVVAAGVTLAVSTLFLFTEPALVHLGQDPALAAGAGRFVAVQIPTLGAFFVFIALRSYLQAREIVRPALLVMALANATNLLFNWALVLGHLGAPALGLVGSGIATSLSRLVLAGGLTFLVWRGGLHHGAWTPWTRQAFEPGPLREMLALGVPIGMQMGLEVWAFSTATLLAGRFGASGVAAHTIALNLAALSFMMPLGVAQAACTRVGNLIGAGRGGEAGRAAWLAIGLGAAVMGLSAASFTLGRDALPRLYTADAAVIALAASVLPIAGAFQVFDGTQVVAAGVLRGMGSTRPAAWLNLLGYWVVALPLAAWLTRRAGAGLGAIWWSLSLGLVLVAGGLMIWIRARGPGRLAATGAATSGATSVDSRAPVG